MAQVQGGSAPEIEPGHAALAPSVSEASELNFPSLDIVESVSTMLRRSGNNMLSQPLAGSAEMPTAPAFKAETALPMPGVPAIPHPVAPAVPPARSVEVPTAPAFKAETALPRPGAPAIPHPVAPPAPTIQSSPERAANPGYILLPEKEITIRSVDDIKDLAQELDEAKARQRGLADSM